jgi:hypothetical protein
MERFLKQRMGVLAVVLVFSAIISLGQSPTAVFNGQVRDTSGAAIPKATLIVINDATNICYTTETNDEGIYSVPSIPPGTYRIQVSKQGFKSIVHPDIVLHLQDEITINFIMFRAPSRTDKLDPNQFLAVLGLILTLPIAIVAILQLIGMEAFGQIGRVTRLFWCPLFWLARFRLAPASQANNLSQGHHYELIREHIPLLMMSPSELAYRAQIYIWEAAFLVCFPQFTARHDIEKRLRFALMVPENWPHQGYDDECVMSRLLWYHSKAVSIYTAEDIEPWTPDIRRDVLKAIEAERRSHLQSQKKAGHAK